jgi:hypothetical protein
VVSEDALIAARKLAEGLEPVSAAARCGVRFDSDAATRTGAFSLPFLGVETRISYPEFEFEPDVGLPPHVRALLVYHLARCDGSEPTGNWRAFADLPDGRFYARAFQGYTGDALARRLGDRSDALPDAIGAIGGTRLPREALETNANAAWIVPALPRVPVVVLWWDADDEFPARAELLFDATAPNHLPTDGCAVLGSWLATRLAAEVESDRA